MIAMACQDWTPSMSNEASLTRERIEQLAYRLWQEAGCPEGQADQIWLQAQGLLQAEEAQRAREWADAAPPILAATPPAARGWRAEASRRFAAWWAYPSKPGSL